MTERVLSLTGARWLYRTEGDQVRLTPREATILTTIAAKRGDVASTEELMQALFGKRGADNFPRTNNISVHINRIRRKVADLLGKNTKIVLSAHRGYQFAPDWTLRLVNDEGAWVAVQLDAETVEELMDLAVAADDTPEALVRKFVAEGIRKLKAELWD